MDELTFYNPSYMLAHFGKLTYPGYPHGIYFDEPVITHPPVHVGLIGLLGRLGFTWYYAEATPTVVFFLVAIIAIVRGAFPATVKLGLLFSIGFVMLTGENLATCFGTRPEGELHAAWLAGLVLLESGRLANWNIARLAAGAFFLTWASGVHYYAAPAFAGVVVYLIWAVWSLGWKDARSRIAALCAGGCVFGIPYLAFYLIPHASKIFATIRDIQGNGGIAASIHEHLQLYKTWAEAAYLPALVRIPMALGVPLMFFSTAALACIRSTRGLAFASIPLQLFVFLFASHKQPQYLMHETALFTAAASIVALTLADGVLKQASSARINKLFLPVATALLILYLLTGNPALQAAVLSAEPHVHEGDLARAAARTILGPNARVAGRLGAWYSSGAEHWWDIESDMLSVLPYEPAGYFANFDAVVEYPHMSDVTVNGDTVSSWYAKGILHLRGFYFGETNPQLQTVLLSARPVPNVVGYAARNAQLYRFEQQGDGDYQVLSAACPMSPALAYQNWISRWPRVFATVLLLPRPAAGQPAVMVTALMPRQASEPTGWMGRTCRVVSKITGSLELADKNALISSLRREDQPIHFYRNLDELPGYVGVQLPEEMTPPKDGLRLNKAIDFSDARTALGVPFGGRPPFSVRIPRSRGLFALAIPVPRGVVINMPCWLQVRLRVDSGRIGLAAYGNQLGIVNRTRASILKSSEPVDVVLKMPDLLHTNYIMVFNDGDTAGQVEVFDAAVVVTPQDWEHNRTRLAPLR